MMMLWIMKDEMMWGK